MTNKRIAFQGEPGAYSEAAAYEHFGAEITPLPCEIFEKVFESVSSGECDFGLIPIENSLAGSIHQNYDLLVDWDIAIVGEYHFRVSHCLMALPGVAQEDIVNVHSHPQALAQCRKKLLSMGVTSIPEKDTAGSARWIKNNQPQNAAALASKRAAEVYDLNILMAHMEDNPANFTRFLALSKTPQNLISEEAANYKTSIAFTLENKPGALFKAMSLFALREIDLTKIESRPIAGKPWEYMFYIDFVGHQMAEPHAQALNELDDLASFMRVLGSYPRHEYVY